MDAAYNVTDSSDWLATPLAPLRSVEAALRCQVCKDFYNTPMITTCSHTFCSLCIRRCLTSEGKCPSCRSSDQEIRLRRNWAVQELVDAFQEARPNLLKAGQELVEARSDGGLDSGKRKLGDTDLEQSDRGVALRRKTRSQSRRVSADQPEVTGEVDEQTTGGEAHGPDYEPDDGMAACPICFKRMKVEAVFPHLDTHQDGQQPKRNDTHMSLLSSKPKNPSQAGEGAKPLERLPSLSYSIMNENTLRKKITTLGIPSWGAKPLLIRRHTEWVNLWNANCDSSKPRSKRELLHDLDLWERTQGGNASAAQGAAGSGGTIMAKDFDGSAWSASHDDDFQRLTAEARRKSAASSSTKRAEETGKSPAGEDERTVINLEDEDIPQS
ncbi:E3 ubiquitin-protein ligase rad18 [Trapelia coarctata]|nr:E3 ubiquitin-protein ligase rad18 [Trapelia coarctata]